MPIKTLITGASGQLGSELQRTATSQFECVALGRNDLDISDAEVVRAALAKHRPELLINAAAYTAVDLAESEPEQAQKINATGAANLARACSESGARLIHISTDFVFDGGKGEPYRPGDEPAPLSVYGQTKLDGETAVLEATGGDAIVFRTAWLYSRFGQNFVKTMLRLAEEGGEASIVDDQVGSPTSALDIADTIFQIAAAVISRSNANFFGTYHYCSDGYGSWADVAEHVFRVSKTRRDSKIVLKRIPTSEYPTPAKRPLNSRLDTTKIEHVFKVKPTDWTEGVTQITNRLIDEGI